MFLIMVCLALPPVLIFSHFACLAMCCVNLRPGSFENASKPFMSMVYHYITMRNMSMSYVPSLTLPPRVSHHAVAFAMCVFRFTSLPIPSFHLRWNVFNISVVRSQRNGTSRRSMLQSDSVQCLAFVPFQASDYQYIRTLANERRRESFALSRDRGRDTSGEVSADSPWSFESLNGTIGDGGRQALTAFPKMNKRSDDLFSAFFIASVQDETGIDINDSVGKSTKHPYYFVHTVCDGNCQQITPEQRATIDSNARSSRSVVSCVDKDELAVDPFAIPLPFTPGVYVDGKELIYRGGYLLIYVYVTG